jgi:hypothetical protein
VKTEADTTPDHGSPIASKEIRAATDRILIHQGRSGVWFMISIVGLLLSSVFAVGAKSTSAWDTWLINWQSNLHLYFAGASLVLCLLNGARATLLHHQVKRLQRGV